MSKALIFGIVSLALLVVLLAILVAITRRARARISALVPGEEELGTFPLTLLQVVKTRSHGSIAPTYVGVNGVRVTTHRLIFTADGATALIVNLAPGVPEHAGFVLRAKRDAVVPNGDRLTIEASGRDGQWEVQRVLVQLPDPDALVATCSAGTRDRRRGGAGPASAR